MTSKPTINLLISAPGKLPLTIFEATLGVCGKRHASVAEGQGDVLEFLEITGVRTVAIPIKEGGGRTKTGPF